VLRANGNNSNLIKTVRVMIASPTFPDKNEVRKIKAFVRGW
jgi:hypothetical protein